MTGGDESDMARADWVLKEEANWELAMRPPAGLTRWKAEQVSCLVKRADRARERAGSDLRPIPASMVL
jgi:hypothetical protein